MMQFLYNFSGVGTKFAKKYDNDSESEEESADGQIVNGSNINAYLDEKGDSDNEDSNDATVNEHCARILPHP